MLKKLVGAALCASAIVGVGGSVFAGEITGGPNPKPTPAPERARSICAFSGQEDGRRMAGGPDVRDAGLGVDHQELAGDELGGGERGGEKLVEVGEDLGRLEALTSSLTEATDGLVRQERGLEVVTHGVEDPDGGVPRSDGVVERVAGHPMGGLEDA